MKTKILLLCCLSLLMTRQVLAQTSFSDQNIITTNADGASSVFAIDLDGDGDNDVLSASFNDKLN